MRSPLAEIFADLVAPKRTAHRAYSTRTVPECLRFRIGKDVESNACLMVEHGDLSVPHYTPIHLQVVDVEFSVVCRVHESGLDDRQGVFSVMTLRSSDEGLVDHFYLLIEVVIRLLGMEPDPKGLIEALERMAVILQKASGRQKRTLTGLFGELFAIAESKDPVAMLNAWRIETSSRYDFSFLNTRVEVKTTTGRERRHAFTYEQCNPPVGTRAAVLSIITEQVASGETIWDLVERISDLIPSRIDLAMKLQQAVADTLGSAMAESFEVRYDTDLARYTLSIFDAEAIPALREVVPAGVSNVRFVSDLTLQPPITTKALETNWPSVSTVLP